MINWSEVLRIPTVAELTLAEQKRLSKKGPVISTHRRYDIVRVDETHYEVWDDSFKQAECGSAWGCVCWIDERLSS